MFISVTAGGLVSGNVPDATWGGRYDQQNCYPAYDYTDMIGGEGALVL
jgi:hypothetical protein